MFEAGLKVPADLSLIGFDDIHLAEYTIPPLATIRMSCKDLAQKAVEVLLCNLLPVEKRPRVETRIGTRLVVRQTTGLAFHAPSSVPRPRRRTNVPR